MEGVTYRSETNPITYRLDGDPIPLARIRISRSSFRIYDSQKELKLVTQITLKNQHGDRKLYKGPIRVDAIFYFHIPKTHKDTKPGYYHVFKPDVDNLCKMILDVGNSTLFHDDCIVSEITCKKVYGDPPRTEFTIYQLENHE